MSTYPLCLQQAWRHADGSSWAPQPPQRSCTHEAHRAGRRSSHGRSLLGGVLSGSLEGTLWASLEGRSPWASLEGALGGSLEVGGL